MLSSLTRETSRLSARNSFTHLIMFLENVNIEVFTKQIRPVLEFSVPVWHPNTNKKHTSSIERVQKYALKIILHDKYSSYESALKSANLKCLLDRRQKICLNFALKCEQHPQFSSWFKQNYKIYSTRYKQDKYCTVTMRTSRLEKSPLNFLTNLLNTYYNAE